ncbi:hypothetical protein QQ056_02060 [Oscillatoria laete-virens NRMC-F 0139]|nr:hypothetical protein [Oscillatoria laete-virens]MDL5052353.1 hypothetical protein [Oscillatoria laete-virens NRMC-F 0139]
MLFNNKTQIFYSNLPLLGQKPSLQGVPEVAGVWRIHWQLGETTLRSTFYTQFDQICLLWGILSLIIFTTAQFSPISWTTQAVWWTMVSLVGAIATHYLTPAWFRKEGFGWVIDLWVGLMLLGTLISDLGIFAGWGLVLMNLCPLWLGISGIGYFQTAWGMRSRTLILIAGLHFAAIAALPWVMDWQFLFTGLILGLSGVILAEFQWDAFGGPCVNQFKASSKTHP